MHHVVGQFVPVSADDAWGDKCDHHPLVVAVKRICTEADSFGCEYSNLCQVCLDEREKALEAIKNDPSKWERCKCGNSEPSLISYRDPDEGMSGPVYEHCSKCHEKWNEYWARENSYYEEEDNWD